MDSPGKIYLAEQRGLTETSILRRYSTFNFEKYFNEFKEPFGSLFLCNDEFIAGGKLTFFLCKANSTQIFIPITGGIDIVAKTKEYAVETGQVQILNMEKGEVLEISNPYKMILLITYSLELVMKIISSAKTHHSISTLRKTQINL